MQMKVVVLCGGMENSQSLLELFMLFEELIEVELQYTQRPMSKSDQRVFVADLNQDSTTTYIETTDNLSRGHHKID